MSPLGLQEDGNGAQESNTLKREREHQGRWPEPAFLGRISLESVDSKRLAGGQEQVSTLCKPQSFNKASLIKHHDILSLAFRATLHHSPTTSTYATIYHLSAS